MDLFYNMLDMIKTKFEALFVELTFKFRALFFNGLLKCVDVDIRYVYPMI